MIKITVPKMFLKLSLHRYKQLALIVVAVAACATGVLLVVTSAATPNASLEAENGTISSNVSNINDSSASGEKAVLFSSGVPAQCASGGSYLWSNLEACGWPGATNTGPDLSQCPGGQLTDNSGSTTRTITINTPDTTISCENITGQLLITAQNVTIKNCIVAWDGGGVGGHGVIQIDDGASATVDHVEINGMDSTHAGIFNGGSKGLTLQHSLVAKYVKIHDVNDGIFSWWWDQRGSYGGGSYYSQYPDAGSNFIIEDSYFYNFTEDAANGHIDGYQTEGAWNGTITHNTYHMNRRPGDVDVSGGGMDSAIAIWDDFNGYKTAADGGADKTVNNITISDNLLAGGGFTIYANDRSPGGGAPGDPTPVGGHEMTNIKITNNSFSTYLEGGCVGEYGAWFYRGPDEGNPNLIWPPYYGGPTGGWGANGNTRSGNTVLETGENIDNNNPHISGNLCT